MIPGPSVPFFSSGPIALVGSCYNTNNRGFSSAATASSKAETVFSFSHIAGVFSANPPRHETSVTRRLDCATGALECEAKAPESGLTALPPVKLGDVINLNFGGEVGNPCAAAPASVTPAIKWAGMISVDTRTQSVRFLGTIAGFPSYEAYLRVDQGPPVTLIQETPAPGATAWSLLTTRSLDKKAKYEAFEGEWKENGDDFRILVAGDRAVITSMIAGAYIQKTGTAVQLDGSTLRVSYPAVTRESLLAERYASNIIDGILAQGKVNTIDLKFVSGTLTGVGRYWGFHQERNRTTGVITRVTSIVQHPPMNATYSRM